MKKNALQNVFKFVFKYIWLFCTLLVMAEVLSTLSAANILMKQSSRGVIESVSGEISGRVDGVLRLLQGLSKEKVISDTNISLFERAILTKPFQDSYGLYMIALTDENVNVISANETEPPKENTSLAYREYMQNLYKSGHYQITDAFLAGADHKTVNYTIAVPIMKNDQVVGSVFGSIYFSDIQDIIDRNVLSNKLSEFYLLGQTNVIVAGNDETLIGHSYLNVIQNVYLLNKNATAINEDMLNGISCTNWEWDDGSLWYTTSQRIENTKWTLVYRVEYSSVIMLLLPGLLFKVLFYISLCGFIYVFGSKYIKRNLKEVNLLLDKMTMMQKELFRSDNSANFDNILEITRDGLKDQLTGLYTRTVLFNRCDEVLEVMHLGVVLFIDLDDLKKINNHFGHHAGDLALQKFASIIKKFNSNENDIVARYGGDEFIVLMSIESKNQIEKQIISLTESLNTSVTSGNHTFDVHGSIGVSFYPENGKTLEELVVKADLALYNAKHHGKNRYKLFDEESAK